MKIILLLTTTLLLFAGIAFGAHYYLTNQSGPVSSFLTKTGPLTTVITLLTLDLQNPDDELLTFDSSTIIQGKTLPKINVLISSASNDQIIQSKDDGSFSYDFELKPGINEITVTVFDSKGQQKQASRTVFYSREKI